MATRQLPPTGMLLPSRLAVSRSVHRFGPSDIPVESVTVLSLPFWSLYNKLTITAVTKARLDQAGKTHRGPVAVLYDTAVKYGLGEQVKEILDTGCIPSKPKWKSLAREVVRQNYNNKWTIRRSLYASMTLIDSSSCASSVSIWWQLCKRNYRIKKMCSLMINMMTGNHSLNCARGKYGANTSLCQLCDSYQTETLNHMLFVCDGLSETRSELLTKLVDAMPQPMACAFRQMQIAEKTAYILNGMNSDHLILEWAKVYTQILVFTTNMYKKRNELIM